MAPENGCVLVPHKGLRRLPQKLSKLRDSFTCSIWLKRLCSNLSSVGCSPCSLIVSMEDKQADRPSTNEGMHSALHASLIRVCSDLSASSIGLRSVSRKKTLT